MGSHSSKTSSTHDFHGIFTEKPFQDDEQLNPILLEFNKFEEPNHKFSLIKEVIYNNKYHKKKYFLTKKEFVRDRISGEAFLARYMNYKFIQYIIILYDYDIKPYWFKTHSRHCDLRGYTKKIFETKEFLLYESDNEPRNLHIKFKTGRLTVYR